MLSTRLRGAARALSIAAPALFIFLGLALSAESVSAQTGADLAVTKTAELLPYTPGSNVEYTVTVESNGPANAFNVQLIDQVPPEMGFVSVAAPAGWS